ncbi:hypothetical protein ACFQU3_19650 [Terrabacter sp. GCM10028922]|uniref:hypothetical protein n=1 Tax=Terrabacter sp. GCM10028922 TaxID=3273428 RepID=UPI003619AB1B
MRDEPVLPARSSHEGFGSAAVCLLALALLLGLGGGLMLVASVVAAPMGPEDEVSDAVWAVPLLFSLTGVILALVGRAGLIQGALVVIGVLLVAASVMVLVESLRSTRITSALTVLAVPLLLGVLAIVLGWRDRQLRRRHRSPMTAGRT